MDGNSSLLWIFSGLPSAWLNSNLDSSKVKTGGNSVNQCCNKIGIVSLSSQGEKKCVVHVIFITAKREKKIVLKYFQVAFDTVGLTNLLGSLEEKCLYHRCETWASSVMFGLQSNTRKTGAVLPKFYSTCTVNNTNPRMFCWHGLNL